MSDYKRINPSNIKFPSNILQNIEKVDGVHYFINNRNTFKMPKMMSAGRRNERIDRLASFVKE